MPDHCPNNFPISDVSVHFHAPIADSRWWQIKKVFFLGRWWLVAQIEEVEQAEGESLLEIMLDPLEEPREIFCGVGENVTSLA